MLEFLRSSVWGMLQNWIVLNYLLLFLLFYYYCFLYSPSFFFSTSRSHPLHAHQTFSHKNNVSAFKSAAIFNV